MPLRVAIIGAGPAGCLLARILLTHGAGRVDVSVFEAESALDVRSQGGTLDLHPRTGIAALKAAGLADEFAKLARPASAALNIADKKLKTYFYLPAALHRTPEIDRAQLRKFLVDALPQHVICWGHCLERVDDAQALTLYFANGTVETGFDLVVGSDGAWSHVRHALVDQTPEYAGIAGYDSSISPASRDAPVASKLIGHGSLFAFSDGKSIMGQQMSDGSIHVSVWGRQDEDWFRSRREEEPHSPVVTRTDLVEGFEDWAPQLQDLALHTDCEIRTTALYMLPVGFQWEHHPGITLVGDAAHVMTPFAGEGVNLALEDAWKLGQAILKAAKHADPVTALDPALTRYEKELFKRSHRAQKMTWDMMKAMYFTPGAPRSGIEPWMVARASYDFSPSPVMTSLCRPLFVAGIYSAYFWIKLFL